MASERTMKAVFLDQPGKFSIRELPIPQPGEREVLVAVKYCGVCGSDMHFYEHGRIGSLVVMKEPLILGHEFAGEVVELGPGVETLAVGDRVTVEPGVPCRYCEHCRAGNYNLCRDLVFKSAPPHNGAFCEYVVTPEDFAFKLPENVSTEDGATVEPLAVGMHAVKLTGLRAGESAVVLGAGPVGLLAVAAAAAAGARDVTAVDLVPMRLEYARRMGASAAVDARQTDLIGQMQESADVVIDCAAVDATILQAFDLVKRGGRIAWVGMASAQAAVPVLKAVLKQISVIGVRRYANCFQGAVNLITAGKIDPAPLVTHRFRFPDVEGAIAFAAGNRERALKTMVEFD